MKSTLRPARATLGAVSALAILAALTGCTPDSGGAESQSTDSAPTESALSAEVAALMQPQDEYPVPTEPVSDPTALQGKTVYYIPITSQAPKFAIVEHAMTEALEALGANVKMCDGKGTPTEIGACALQATESGAAAIVTDAIYYNMAANAFDAAQAAGIPVLNTNQIEAEGHPASDTLGYVIASDGRIQAAIAKWVIEDSAGEGQVLINSSVDGPAPAIFLAEGQRVYDAECPGCTQTVNEITSSNFSQIPSSTSAELLRNPNIGYVVSQFDQYLMVTQQGVEQTGRMDEIRGVTGSAQLNALQQLQAESFLYAAVGDSSPFNGWINADAVLRLVAGDELPEYTVPIRLFTRDSVADLELTEAAQASGEWYGPTDFPDRFRALWGLS